MSKSISTLTLLAILAAPLTAGARGYDGVDAIVAAETSAELEANLLQLREEEKLARDVYLTLHDEWGTSIFERISRSEQRHMDAVKGLLDAYQIADPITDDSVGVFRDPSLQALYDDLIAQGMQSELDALIVGATIEDLDISDIRAMQENTDSPRVLSVYASLECGSSNHLRAFTDLISQVSTDYEPQFLTSEEYEAVLDADAESCGQGAGSSNGAGGRN